MNCQLALLYSKWAIGKSIGACRHRSRYPLKTPRITGDFEGDQHEIKQKHLVFFLGQIGLENAEQENLFID
ncbi:MAG: hypothetical protein R2788_20010 [Saprospiraceae bacterium]